MISAKVLCLFCFVVLYLVVVDAARLYHFELLFYIHFIIFLSVIGTCIKTRNRIFELLVDEIGSIRHKKVDRYYRFAIAQICEF